MISGAVYTVFGMQKRWIHCFFSFAFLVAMAITALELLLVSTPISDARQGGFIVGVIAGGAAGGGLATLRPTFFHCFGSVLGGFCFAMWLLTLKQSSLLGQDTLKNSIFLAAFSLVSLGFYCNTRTRHYLVMFSSCFSGATAFIIGVDCVSCAGLKEFWAWTWNLPNDELFPIDADTYPLETGMKAELGVTVVLFLLGVVFQWAQLKPIKEQLIRKEEERNEGQAAVERTNEKAGLESEKKIAAERREFEAKYSGPHRAIYTGRGSRTDNFLSPMKKLWKSLDDKRFRKEEPRQGRFALREVGGNTEDAIESRGSRQTSIWDDIHGDPKQQVHTSVHTAHDSGMGYAETEREHRISGSAATVTQVSAADDEPEIELNEIRPAAPLQPEATPGAVEAKDKTVAVHVAVDEVDVAAAAWNPVPEVTPLPFKVPCMKDEEEESHADEEECSSVAVMTEGFHNNELLETRSIGSKRSSFAKRLSTSSADLLRRLSHHSLSSHLDKAVIGQGESTENLAVAHEGDRTSIAATCDDASSVDEERLPAPASLSGERPLSIQIKAELADDPTDETTEDPGKTSEAATKKTSEDRSAPVPTASAGTLEPEAKGRSTQDDQSTRDLPNEDKSKQVAKADSDDVESLKPAKTNISEATSQPLNLATGKLEKKVSAIVKQYRMVEWAKHQTLAEEPILDNLDLPELGGPSEAVPVDVEDLLKTAGAGAPRVAKPRTEAILQALARKSSSMSQSSLSPKPHIDRTGSRSSDERQAIIQATAAALMGDQVHRESPTPYEIHAAAPAGGSPGSRPPVPGVKSYNSPQSLVAKRETLLRMKQQALRPDSLQPTSVPTSGLGLGLVHDHGQSYRNVAALGPPSLASDPKSTPSSRRNSGSYRSANVSSALQNDPIDDDLPLSQRQAIIRERRNSMNSANSSGNQVSSEGSSRRSISGLPPRGYGSSSSLAMNQTMPHTQRRSFSAGQSRESQLAGFRSPAQADLRASNTGLPITTLHHQPGFGGEHIPSSMTPVNGPLINSVYTIPGTSSSNSLLPQQTQPWNAELSKSLDVQRQYLMAQKQTDARRRESRRLERERQSQMRQSSMGTHRLLDAHSAALMNLQKKARDAL